MVRADRNYPDVYFGRPGAFLKLPYPRGDMDKTYDRAVYDFITGTGQHQVSSLIGGSRLRTVNWKALHVDNYAILERFWTGMAGVGPWAFIDPSDRNLLLPNQASATSTFNDSTGWVTSTGATNMGQILSNAAGGTTQHSVYNARSLRWYFNVAAATTPVLQFTTPYRGWFGFPVVPGLSYKWAFWARPDGTVDASITLAAKLRWYDSAGVELSDLTGGDTVTTTWTRLSVGGVAPAGAAYAFPRVVATGSTITTGASVYIDEPILEQDTVLNDWAPGTGIRPVEILNLTDAVPFNASFRQGISLVLRELAP